MYAITWFGISMILIDSVMKEIINYLTGIKYFKYIVSKLKIWKHYSNLRGNFRLGTWVLTSFNTLYSMTTTHFQSTLNIYIGMENSFLAFFEIPNICRTTQMNWFRLYTLLLSYPTMDIVNILILKNWYQKISINI